MKKIAIPLSVLNHSQDYLLKENKVDILGAILLESGYTIPDKARLPSDLKQEIPLFTRSIRRRIVDTPLTQTMMTLSFFPQGEALKRANQLLHPHFQLELILHK